MLMAGLLGRYGLIKRELIIAFLQLPLPMREA